MSRTIEDQLAALGDAVDEALSEAADAPVVSLDEHRQHRLGFAAAAAALVLVVVGIALVGRTMENSSSVIADQPQVDNFVVTDPLDIDLSALVAQSDQRRISEIGEQLTFDWDALPEEWEVTVMDALIIENFGDEQGDDYLHEVDIGVRGALSFTVRIWGAMEQGAGAPVTIQELDPLVATEVEVRGQPGQLQNGSLKWIEADTLHVTVSGPPLGELEDDLFLIAESLQPVVAPLPWGPPEEFRSLGSLSLIHI